MDAKVGIGFIGAGSVSLWHYRAVVSCPRARLVGVFDVAKERARKAAKAYRTKAYTSLAALLADPEVDAVSVLSPVEKHYEHAIAALKAGKHILIEKPVSTSTRLVGEIARLARRKGLICMPAHNYIYSPALWRAKRLIEGGDLGTITTAWINYTIYHPEEVAAKYPGVLRQIMTHHVYSLIYLLGKPVRLSAFATSVHYKKLRLEDQVAMILEMQGGALVNLFGSFAADDQTSEPWTVVFKVLGTKGGTMYSWRDSVSLSPGGGLAWRYPAYEESFAHEVKYFVENCILGGEEPLSSIEDAVAAQAIIEAAERSIATGRAVKV